MTSFTHIINPVAVEAKSRFYFVQKMTFYTMQQAKTFASSKLDVELFSAQFPEDHQMIENGFTATANLTQSVLDIKNFQVPRKLPILQDILMKAYLESQSDYVIYTNVDIGLQSHFYEAVSKFIDQGLEAFVINRRTVSDRYTTLGQLDEIYQDSGKPHRGWDCFVFPRTLIPDLNLGTICIGIPLMGLGLFANLMVMTENFKESKNEHLTFHLGDDKAWNNKLLDDYRQHNYQQLMIQLQHLEDVYGSFPVGSAPARFLSWQAHPLKAAIYRYYTRNPLPVQVANLFKKGR